MSIVKQVYQTATGEEELTIVVDEYNDFWFLGVVIAKILGYKSPRNIINTKVESSYKKSLNDLMTNGRTENRYDDSLHPHTIFLNEFGLYQLIMSSKLEAAKQFQHWVYGLIKSLRRGDCNNEVSILHEQNMQLTNSLVEANKRNEAMFSELVKSNQRNEETTKELIKSNQRNEETTSKLIQIVDKMVTMAQDVVIKPQNEKLLHAIAVYDIGTAENDEHSLRCKILRTQQHRVDRAGKKLQELNPKSKLIFKKKPCPNGFNILNAVKEEMNNRDIPFKAKANEIQVSVDENTIASLFSHITNKNIKN